MNAAQAHLLVNHVPLFAAGFGLLALIAVWIWKSNDLRRAAIVLFILAGISGWASDLTGDQAEEVVEHLPGVTEHAIHEHEEAADYAKMMTSILAVGAIGLAVSIRKKPQWTKPIQIGLTLLALLTATSVARTAHLGGLIRHSEIRGDGATHDASPSPEEHDGD